MAQINGLQPFGNFSLIYQRICLRRTLLVLKCVLFERISAVFLYTTLTKELIKLFAITAGL